MGGENTAYPLLTAKAGAVVAEGLKLSLATPGGSLTPATITAMVGIAKGEALDLAPEVKTVMAKLEAAKLPTLGIGAGGLPIPNPNYHPQAATALSNLTNLQGKLLPSGNHGAFGAFLSQAQGHIADSIEINNATAAVSKMNFADFGSGVTNLSSMVDQGLTAKLGNLGSAGDAMAACGKMFDTKDMANFGTGAGLINQITANKLGNSTGLSKALADAGVDLNNLSDPVYKDTIDNVLGSVTDPKILKTVATQLKVDFNGEGTTTAFDEVGTTTFFGGPVPGGPASLKDFLDINKIVPPNIAGSVTGGFADIGKKFADMGAGFASPDAAKNMLKNISLPSVPNLDSSAANLNSLMASHKSTIDDMIGKNLTSSPNGIPNVTDFAGIVGGGGNMLKLSQSTDIAAIVAGVQSQVTNTNAILSKAGIDVNSPPPAGLSTAKNFAEGLHKFGADTSGSGVSQLLGNMAKSGSAFGDSIKASLAEGKNKVLMQASGVKPFDFGGVPIGEGLKNLQQGKFIPGTGSMTPEQINGIFGSGT